MPGPDPAAGAGDRAGDADRDEVARWWTRLGPGLGELVEIQTLAGGASGSIVHRLLVDLADGAGRGEFVLKIAYDPDTRERAGRELNFYRDLAPRVPVLVPRLVGSAEHRGAIGLLFESAGTTPRPDRWSADRWAGLASELGGLHGAALATVVAGWPWAKVVAPAARSELGSAAASWTALGYASLLEPVWTDFDRLEAALAGLPVCLRHGDWHLGNLLTDGSDRFVWIDWQEVGLGHGPEDLALLWQRAEFDGFRPPRDVMLTAYARSRGVPDDPILRRAAVAAELALLLLSWPPYLAGAPEPARVRLLRRLEYLVGAWDQRRPR